MTDSTPESADIDGESPDESVERSTADAEAVADETAGEEEPVSLVEAQSIGREYAEQLLSGPVDNVIQVGSDGDGWRVVVEVVERSAVPDTQDILARYEMSVDAGGDLSGYSLIDRYHRGDARGDL